MFEFIILFCLSLLKYGVFFFFMCALKCFILDVSDLLYDTCIFKKYYSLLKFEDFSTYSAKVFPFILSQMA